MGSLHYQPEQEPKMWEETLQLRNRKHMSKELCKWACSIICNLAFSVTEHSKSGVGELWPAGQIRRTTSFCGALKGRFFFFTLLKGN